MTKFQKWITTALAVSVAAGVFTLQNNLQPPASENVQSADVTPVPETVAPVESLTPTLAYEGCGFMWATHDAPELTEKIDLAVREMNDKAWATANFFGEDCVYADGRTTFGVMEADVFVHLPVDDLLDNEFFGDWIAQVMAVIVQIPKEEFQNKYGFVEFWFEASETEHLVVRVPIQKYLDVGQGASGVEMLQLFIEAP